ncbi:MAG: hypothetical protein J0I40_08910 [Cellulomonas sp.]|uniref:SAF domain-containing protein n=1 Tax=Cellulomonas sp. 73-92 TaxID=1895740 RepID=UPI000B20C57E|nr:SAF domain-containing protein [Cellulomonas sp. 73-92]MBN9375492.1 hypothetical protein [Cellulomonas sp.]
MTTTSERRGQNGLSAAVGPRPAGLVTPRGRRRPGLLIAGIAMAILGGLAVIWLVSASGHRVPVVMVAHDVAYGSVLTREDVTTTSVAVDPSVSVMAAGQLSAVVGQRATVNLHRGALLGRADVTSSSVVGADQVLVPLPLPAGRVPASGLSAGDRLQVVDAPAAGADPAPGVPRSFSAQVVRVGSADVNGTVVVDVVASAGDGPALATRAATGRFVIVVLPVVTP